MKRGVVILALLVIVTIIGGLLTAGLGVAPPTLIQSTDPAASPFDATPQQALYFVLWIGFVLVNVIGAGLTIALLFWLGSREVKRANATPARAELAENDAASLPETAQDVA